MPWHQQWLNWDAKRTARFVGSPVSSGCVSPLNCAPDFVIAGSGHAGSTSLYALLMQHPQLVPAAVKEVNFLGLDAHWLNRSRYAEALYPSKSGGPREGQLLGDASPFYLSSPVAPAQLRYLAPMAKIIVILRAPPDHCWSASAAAVMRAVNLSRRGSGGGGTGVSTDRGGPASFSGGICSRIEHTVPSRLLADYFPCDPRKGFAPNLARWLDYFGPRRVLVLLLEALQLDPDAQAARAWRFLGLAPWRIPLAQQARILKLARGAHVKSRLPLDVRRMLEVCLAEPARALERLIASRMSAGSAPHLRSFASWRAVLTAKAASAAAQGTVAVRAPADRRDTAPVDLAVALQPPRIGVVMHTHSRAASSAQSAVADNMACYCAATRSCTLFYAHTRREASDASGTALQLPWYDAPVIIGATQNGSPPVSHADGGQPQPGHEEAATAGALRLPVNRPRWPLHHFAKLVRLAAAWGNEGSPDWLWYVDGDVRVLNYSVRIDGFLPPECNAASYHRDWSRRARGEPTTVTSHAASVERRCDDVGLVVVDHPWAGIVAGSFLVRRSRVGLDILRHIWECQLFAPRLGDQAGLADAILLRTRPRNGAAPYTAYECISSPRWRPGGWRGVTQCWSFHMARMGHPYGNRSTPGVRYIDPRGADLQAFSFHNYGERTPEELAQAYGSNNALDPALRVRLPLATSRNDAIFQRGDLLVHSSMLGGARRATPDLLDAVGSLPGLALRSQPRARTYNHRHLRASDAAAAISACLRGPTVTYSRRPLLAERPMEMIVEVFVLRRAECPDSGANLCPPVGNASQGKNKPSRKQSRPKPARNTNIGGL